MHRLLFRKPVWVILGVALVAALVFGVMALNAGGDQAQADEFQFHGASIKKACVGPNGDAANPKAREGETVTCTIRVTNDDDFGCELTINSISDVVHHASGDVPTGNLLAAPVALPAKGDFVDVSHSYVVEVGDNNPLRDDAASTGTDPVVGGFSLTYPGLVDIIHPHTTLTKTASPTDGRAPLAVTYTYRETNDGDDPISNVALSDDLCSPLVRQADDPGDDDNILEVGETWVFTCTMTHNTAGTYTNHVTATGTAADGLPAPEENAQATVTVINPHTTLTKTASPTDGRAPLTVTYTYRETNDGDDPISNVALTDDLCAPVVRGADDPGDDDNILEVGETWVFTCTMTHTTAGTYTNHVTATGTAADGLPAPEEYAQATVTVTTGGEGCTPGYWKQPQHFDSWTPPYDPPDKFSDVFARLITVRAGGKRIITDPTLLQALQANGGGINALVRHGVAALLNAASPGVAYAFSPDAVIAMVQAAIDSGDYETTKDLLAAENERGCPLN